MAAAGVVAGPGVPAMAAGPGIITTVAGGPGRGPDWSVTQHPLSVATGPGGAVYVTDQIGVVREFTNSATWESVVAGVGGLQGSVSLTYGGDGGAATRAHLSSSDGMAIDGSGNLVIADTANNRIRVVAESTGTFYGQAMTTGDIYTIAGNGTSGVSTGDGGPATAAALDSPRDIAIDAAGNLAIPTENEIRVVAATTGTFYGQAMTAGDIYRIAGGSQGIRGDGGPALLASLTGPRAAAIDAAGNVIIADTGNARIRVVAEKTGTFYGQAMTAGDIYRIAGNLAGFSGDGGPGTAADLLWPGGVSMDGSGNVVIADSGNFRIRVVAATTGTFYGQAMTAGDIYTVAGRGFGYAGDGGPATGATLNWPEAAAFDGNGNMIIADTDNNRIRVVAATTGTFYGRAMTAGDIYTVAGHSAPLSGNGGPALSAVLGTPDAVAATGSGTVAVGTPGEMWLVPATAGSLFGQVMVAGHIYAVAGNGRNGFSGDGGPATTAELDNPSGLAFDGTGNLLIADTDNNRIRVVAATTGTFYGRAMTAGDIYTLAGDGTPGFSGDGGPATTAELGDPAGVAFDGNGNLLIADTGNNRIRVVAAATGTFYGRAMTAGDIYTLAGNGTPGFSGNGGRATSAELNRPDSVAVDAAGNIVIADEFNNRVRVVAVATGPSYGRAMTAGDIYTLAGSGNDGYFGDGGPGPKARLAFGDDELPVAVAVDGSAVLITDTGNSVLREVSS
jgi:hypothetical protein